MFEKEAEEILNNHCDCELLPECIAGIRCRCSDFEESKKLLIEGIEFGYNKAFVEADKNLKAIIADFNKANEWHSYAERPKERLNALCFDSAQNQFILGYYDIESDEWIKYGGYETITMDMWKKIVPPKESE